MNADVVVRGSGPEGHPAAIRAAQPGADVACIERKPELRATRLRTGSIPAKARPQAALAPKQASRRRQGPRGRIAVTGRSRRAPDPAGRDPARVVAFTDAVIAIAVTLLVLEIRPPQDTRHLLHGLAALWPSYVSYVITFMLIGQVWANHHVMFDHIRHADRLVLFLNTVLLMDIAFLPFAAAVLASSFRDGQGERTAVVLHGIAFELAAALFNVIWWHARHDHRLLASTIDPAGVRAISRRFQLALAWLGAGTLLGALLPTLGAGVIAAFIVYYWLPISGEIGHQPRTGRSPMAAQRRTRLTRSATRSPKPNHRASAAEPMFRTRHREEGIHTRAARRARDPSTRMATTRSQGRLPLPPATTSAHRHFADAAAAPRFAPARSTDVSDPPATMVPSPRWRGRIAAEVITPHRSQREELVIIG